MLVGPPLLPGALQAQPSTVRNDPFRLRSPASGVGRFGRGYAGHMGTSFSSFALVACKMKWKSKLFAKRTQGTRCRKFGKRNALQSLKVWKEVSFERSVSSVLCRAGNESEADPLLAEAKAAAEAAKLQLEAAKLRAEAEELQRVTAQVQRKERALRILGSEEIIGIGLPELMVRLQQEGIELSGEQGLALAKAMGFQEEPYFFRIDNLMSEAFDKKISEIQAENLQARQAAAKKQEEERQAAQAQNASASAANSPSPEAGTPEVVNDDRGSFFAKEKCRC